MAETSADCAAVNLMKPAAAAEHRALARKRRRFLEGQAGGQMSVPALHSIVSSLALLLGPPSPTPQRALSPQDNTSGPAGERAFFLNNSPCSSGGSLELPKAPAESFGESTRCPVRATLHGPVPPDALRHSEPLLAADPAADRDPRFGEQSCRSVARLPRFVYFATSFYFSFMLNMMSSLVI